MGRFMRKGVTKVWFVPAITDLTAMTTAEQTAGTELTPQLAEVNGFSFTNNPISTPDMDNQFVSQVTGEDTADQSSMTFYEDDGGADAIQTLLAKGTTGFIVFFYAGTAGASPASGDDYEAWPVTVSAAPRMYSAGNEAAQYRVDFAITAVPDEGTQAA